MPEPARTCLAMLAPPSGMINMPRPETRLSQAGAAEHSAALSVAAFGQCCPAGVERWFHVVPHAEHEHPSSTQTSYAGGTQPSQSSGKRMMREVPRIHEFQHSLTLIRKAGTDLVRLTLG